MDFLEVWVDDEQQIVFQNFCDSIQDAIKPFKTGDLELIISPGFHKDTITIVAATLKEYPCTVEFERDPSNPYEFLVNGKIAAAFKVHFQNIHVPSDGNIQLGLE